MLNEAFSVLGPAVAAVLTGFFAFFLFNKKQERDLAKTDSILKLYQEQIQELEVKKARVDVGKEIIQQEINTLHEEMLKQMEKVNESSLEEIVSSLNNRYPKQ